LEEERSWPFTGAFKLSNDRDFEDKRPRRMSGRVSKTFAYRVLAAQHKPDHATLARFVEPHREALAGVFGSVLGRCAKAGLVGVNVVAVDGNGRVPGRGYRRVCR
jgi:hypothetical protein